MLSKPGPDVCTGIKPRGAAPCLYHSQCRSTTAILVSTLPRTHRSVFRNTYRLENEKPHEIQKKSDNAMDIKVDTHLLKWQVFLM